MALIKNNAKIAAQIAVELSKLKAKPENNCELKSTNCENFILKDNSNKAPVST